MIQSLFRMAYAINEYKSFTRDRLWWHRASRMLAITAQKLWRGFKGRSRYRRFREMATCPDPLEANNFAFWEKCQVDAYPPKRELGIYAEYTLSGHPVTWAERNLAKRHGVFYRDVSFYANTITKRASWTKPKGWMFKDQREYYVYRVQTFWRARAVRKRIRLLVKAQTLLVQANSKVIENTTMDITSLCNYTLYVHVVIHDYDRARELYGQVLEYMNRRGVDNAFVLYSYAIFGAVTSTCNKQISMILYTVQGLRIIVGRNERSAIKMIKLQLLAHTISRQLHSFSKLFEAKKTREKTGITTPFARC